jgi:hypothetical protein
MCHQYVIDLARHERLRKESTKEAEEQVADRGEERAAPADD